MSYVASCGFQLPAGLTPWSNLGRDQLVELELEVAIQPLRIRPLAFLLKTLTYRGEQWAVTSE